MAVTTREEFKAYCLRSLGDGVIRINVTDAQVEDRIDEAVQKFQDHHMDGHEEMYLTHQVTSTDISNGYIPISNEVLYLVGVFGISESSLSRSLLDINFQIKLDMVKELHMMGGIGSYVQTRQYLNLMDDMLNGELAWRYHRYGKKLYLDIKWGTDIKEGDFIAYKAYVRVDPDVDNIWNNGWLKKYAAALIQKQWGSMLSKYEGVILLGGVTMNGSEIESKAKEELIDLEEELSNKWSEPIDFLVG